jgi:cysteine-rich repeat protein
VCAAPICGDGVVNGADACDDSNTLAGDGCSDTCAVEAGYTCMGAPSACDPICGDGLVVGGEPCDDGNANNGDGCTACVVDAGYVCSGEPSVCQLQQIVTVGPGLNASIVDDAYTGALTAPSMTCVDIVVPSEANNTVASMTVQLGMAHTYVGDLVFKLISPANTVVTLMSRPGYAEAADNGAPGGFGNGAGLSNAFPVTFLTGAPTSAESMGATGGTVCQTDGICSYNPNPGSATPGDLTTFAGQASNGTWKFCAGDTAGGDTGAINAVTLTILK